MLKRNKQVIIRLTDKEYETLHTKADTAGISMNLFIRRLIDGCKIRPRPPDSYKELAREIAAVGNNLNQITHLANSTGYISPEQIQRVTALMSQIWQLVQERV